MIDQTDDLANMLAEAQIPGDPEQPSQLLHALREAGIGIAALSGQADVEPFFTAFISEFGYFPTSVPGQPPLAPERRARWVALFRWIFAELTGWTAEADAAGQKLGSILITAQAATGGRQVWASMPEAVARNIPLLRMLKAVVRSVAVEFAARGEAPEPIWEREAVERFKVADQSGDWAEIGGSLRLFEQQLLHHGVILTQSARLLAQCGVAHLVDATSAIQQTLVALQLAGILGRRTALMLAAASRNAYVQFACVYWATSIQQQGQPLTTEEQHDTSAILSRVADERDRWTAWMNVFNTYPSRYPVLQEPLGQTLATADERAIRAYVESVQLYPWPVGREHGRGRSAVADCLRAFRATAPLAQRQVLWLFAYERWNAWNFAGANETQHLLAIHWSDLDFAIVAFASECLDEGERRRQLDEIRLGLQDLDLQWYSSVSEIWTAWNRLCSRFQPFAHAAESSESGADWLCESRSYLPFDPANNVYVKAKFGMQ